MCRIDSARGAGVKHPRSAGSCAARRRTAEQGAAALRINLDAGSRVRCRCLCQIYNMLAPELCLTMGWLVLMAYA